MKKIIIVLSLIILTIGIKAKAIQIDLGKPIAYGDELRDGQWLIMTTQQLENMDSVFRNIGIDKQERFYKTLKYNDAQNLWGVDIYYNFPNIDDQEMILDFYYAYETAIVTADGAPNQRIQRVHITYTDNSQKSCGIVQFNSEETLINKYLWVNHIKCIATKTIKNIHITYLLPIQADFTDRQQYVSYNTIIKDGTDEELLETQQEILTGIQRQNELITNAYSGTIDTTTPSTTIPNQIIQEQTNIMNKINGMDEHILSADIDTNANQRIWIWATDLIDRDVAIRSMYIIILSLGVVKLMLGR